MAGNKKKSKVEEAKSDEQFYNEVYEQIMREKPFAEELSKYSPGHVTLFYEFLVDKKVAYMKYGAIYYKLKQEAESVWVQEAMNGLKEIQIKKLFDLHCLWDAEKITLPDIVINNHFFIHTKNPLGSSLISPISQEEFEMYKDYINSNNYEVFEEFFFDISDYNEIRQEIKDDEDFHLPEWFDFHNSRTGNGVYLSFPMIRTEKEMFYRRLAIAERDKKHEEVALVQQQKVPESINIISLPKIPYGDNKTIEFIVSSFEDKETQNMYKKYNRMYQPLNDSEYDYQDMMDILAQHCEVWPIEAHYDWREAFNNCYQRYRKHKIAEALPLAYEEYKMFVEMNIPFEVDEFDDELAEQLNDIISKQILRGRVLNNEPEDFNF